MKDRLAFIVVNPGKSHRMSSLVKDNVNSTTQVN